MRLLGVVASSYLQSTPAFNSIATTTVGSGGASSVTFTESNSAWASYTHLQVRGIVQTTGGDTEAQLKFNSDATSTNYATHQIIGNGSSASATSAANSGYIKTGITSGSGSYFGGFIIDILDFKNTSKNKTVKTASAGENRNTATGYTRFASGVWLSTSAITSITFTPSSGNFSQYSRFALYGIKA